MRVKVRKKPDPAVECGKREGTPKYVDRRDLYRAMSKMRSHLKAVPVLSGIPMKNLRLSEIIDLMKVNP